MTELKHDPEFPYVVLFGEWVAAKFPAEGRGKVNAIKYANESVGTVIDTTPKPKIPEDAEFILWPCRGGGIGPEFAVLDREGFWIWDGERFDTHQMLRYIGDAEVTVLVPKASQ